MSNKQRWILMFIFSLFVVNASIVIPSVSFADDSGYSSDTSSGDTSSGADSGSAFDISGSFGGGSTGGTDYAADMDAFGMEAITFIACSLRGTVGMLIAGIGGIMALWEYFVQHRQMHMLYALLAVGLTFMLGAALPVPSGGCSGTDTGGGSDSSFSFNIFGGG